MLKNNPINSGFTSHHLTDHLSDHPANHLSDHSADKTEADKPVSAVSIARPRPVVLLLLDGWGIAAAGEGNAISAAKTPTFLNLIKEYPVALLAAGEKNLNARYLTLGAGREITSEEETPTVTLTALLAAAGLKQLKIAETERFAALTHFFNGQTENKAAGEEWKIISSETGRHVVKFSLALRRTVKELIKDIESDESRDLITAVLPTLDLVAESGDFEAVKKAATEIDKSLRNIVAAVLNKRGVLIVSAACGNAEKIRVSDTELVDRHMTDSPVPLLIINEQYKGRAIGPADTISGDLSLSSPIGTLADVAPTVLEIIGLEKPVEMTGKSLLEQG